MKRTALLRKTRLSPVSRKKRESVRGISAMSKGKRRLEWITIYRDGREKLNLHTERGAVEYHRRKWVMRDRQNEICCLFGFIPECPGYLRKCDTSFEHEDGRGGGKHDDRIEKDGRPYNGAAHFLCNTLKGSRYIPYNSPKESR